jgi:RHS repeat-associated protein
LLPARPLLTRRTHWRNRRRVRRRASGRSVYNYFRDYDPVIGRYVQSDPIGLAGGINTFGYALANPLVTYDPHGLAPPSLPDWVVNGAAAFGDSYSLFGFSPSRYIRDAWGIGSVDACSTAYANGGLAGAAVQLIGGAGLIRRALMRRPGTEWSHWIPDRYIRAFTRAGVPGRHYKPWLDNRLGRFLIDSRPGNGNYVTQLEHRMTDAGRNYAGMTNALHPRWSFLRQQLNRVPGWIPGAALVHSAADR